MKKALFIGGTGTISAAIVRRLVNELGWQVWLLNRGNRPEAVPEGAHSIVADINDEAAVLAKLGDMTFDCVCEFIGFTRDQVERDYRLFRGRTRQYIYTSSASAYHKPAASYIVTEGTTLANPHWEYSRNKIACEEFLMKVYREEGFPVTIVRPSHTYDERSVPLGVHGKKGSWQVIKRMLEGKPVIIQGDGTSLWTMTHAADVAVGFVGLMGKPEAIGEVFGVTSAETLTWNQIYTHIANALGVPYKPYYVSSSFIAETSPYGDDLWGDKANCVIFDITKIQRVVPEYHPTIGFAEGARRTVEYILAHPECQTEDPAYDEWCDRLIEAQEAAKAMMLEGGK